MVTVGGRGREVVVESRGLEIVVFYKNVWMSDRQGW